MTNSGPPAPEQVKEQQQQGWARSATPWRKWFAEMVTQGRAATELLLQEAQVKPAMRVLDLASGTGDPALALAEAVAPSGQVTATDLVPEMLAGLAEHARARGVSNLTVQQADMEALPFPDAQFDVVTCRFGLMFCPDVGRALREIRRVLKPGGRAAFLVWGTPDQPFFTTTVGTIAKHVHPSPTPPLRGAPTPFRFAEAGSLATALREGGFRDVREQPHTIAWPFPGPPERAWDYIREVTGVGIPEEKYDQVTTDVIAALRQYYDGQWVDTTAQVILASGVS